MHKKNEPLEHKENKERQSRHNTAVNNYYELSDIIDREGRNT